MVREGGENRALATYRVDFLWLDVRLVVELDDRESHLTPMAFTDDRVRDRWLQARGYTVLRFTVTELRTRPATVAAEIAAALGRLSPRSA